MIVEACKEYKERYVYTILKGEKEKKVKYEELIKDIYRVSNYFADMYLQKKTIAILGKNSYEWIVIYCAILFSGNSVAPLDKDISREEVDLFMKQLQCVVLLFDGEKKEIMENEFPYNAYTFGDIVDRASNQYTDSENVFKRMDAIFLGASACRKAI